ncbi:MAG TPA: hypothetical protein VGS19_03915 [Streptosporangiaceae bacterium]|nr:hypothetical protein [Streptosporangiaceae bacterium]
MADVSIYVAVIAAAAGVAGAAVPTLTVMVRDVAQAKRDRNDRLTDRWQQACLDLVRSAQQLRTKVVDAAQYHGPEMAGRLEEIRGRNAEVQVHAVMTGLFSAERLGRLADDLAEAASQLTTLATKNANMEIGEMDPKPDSTGFSESIKAFSKAFVSESRG